jgi:hypothetical protein
LVIVAHTAGVAGNPAVADERQRLARLTGLWIELQAARKDPAKYEAIAARFRQEADAYHQMWSPPLPNTGSRREAHHAPPLQVVSRSSRR